MGTNSGLTFFGYRAGISNTSPYNTAFGYEALVNNTGEGNTALGFQTLYHNSTGNRNIAIGSHALFANVSGQHNIAIGDGTNRDNTLGSYNIGLGSFSLFTNYGNRNTAVGYEALKENVLGSNNTALGSGAGPVSGSNNLNNTTAIGYNAKVTQSNSLILGGTGADKVNVGIGRTDPGFPLNFEDNTGDKISLYGGSGDHYGFGVQPSLLQIHTLGNSDDIAFGYGRSSSFIERMRIKGDGRVGIGTSNPSYTLHVNGSIAGTSAYQNISDARFKKNVTQLSGSLSKVLKIRGVIYDWRKDEFPDIKFDDKKQMGFIAQELEQIVPEAVEKNKSTGYYTVSYSTLIPVLVEAIKEQQVTIEKLQKENTGYSKELKALFERIEKLEAVFKK
jgi:hypothetical protein